MTTLTNVKTTSRLEPAIPSKLYEALEQIRAIADKSLWRGEISSASALDRIEDIATLACASVWRDNPELEWGDDPLGAWHGRNA
jgi:hypothetical protein